MTELKLHGDLPNCNAAHRGIRAATAAVKAEQSALRRLRCFGRHKWIALDDTTRQCWRCDYVQRRERGKWGTAL